MTKLIGPSARKQLRRRYRETWGRDWPENDEYLTVLWNETKRPGAAWATKSSSRAANPSATGCARRWGAFVWEH
jgi:hypothetical protein